MGNAEDVQQQVNFSYDTNPFDPNRTFSQNTWGRLAAVTYNSPGNGPTFAEWYSYTSAGQKTGKRLQVTQAYTYQDRFDQTQWTSGTTNLDSGYTYNNEGQMLSMSYPSTNYLDDNGAMQTQAGPSYNYTVDSMGRLAGMTDQNNVTGVSNVTYGPGNQLLTMNFGSFQEARSYNSPQRLTDLNVSGSLHMQYNSLLSKTGEKIATGVANGGFTPSEVPCRGCGLPV